MQGVNIRWGILSAGKAAAQFAEALPYTGNGELAAVCSRDIQKAESLAGEYGDGRGYDHMKDFLGDETVQAVYIATPNRYHYEHVLLCLRAGKHVLCEKPLGICANEVRLLAQEARERGLFLMEGIGMCFYPAVIKALEWIEGGLIGKPLRVNASFCLAANKGGWRFRPGEGGGALLSLGLYPLALCTLIFGTEPSSMKSIYAVKNGVDVGNSILLGFDEDQIATLVSGIDGVDQNHAVIIGEKGYIEITPDFWSPERAAMFSYIPRELRKAKLEVAFEAKYEGSGVQYMAAHVAQCILAGKVQSDILPLEGSLRTMKLVDRLHAEWGIEPSGSSDTKLNSG